MKLLREFIVKFLASAAFIGYVPVLPGTTATAFAVILYWLAVVSWPVYFCFVAGFLILGFLTAGLAEKIIGEKDSKHIVIDEISGVFLTFFLIPKRIEFIFLGFLLFRLLDITKPPPIRRLEKLNGSLGIMLDDIMAAVYSNILLQLAVKFVS